MCGQSIHCDGGFRARLVADRENDLAIEVATLQRSGVSLVEIIKIRDIVPENLNHHRFLAACECLDKPLAETLREPVRFTNERQ